MSQPRVVISLTPEQRALIREASGKDVTELTVHPVATDSGWLLKPPPSVSIRKKPRVNPQLARFRLKVRKSRIHGWGVFAAQPIPAGSDVIEYVGEIVTPQEYCQRVTNADEVYAIEIDETRTIDGAVGGSGAEIINHSCSPNMQYRRVGDHVFVRSIRSIEVGEELTADYRFRREVPQASCRCGASNCRGIINRE